MDPDLALRLHRFSGTDPEGAVRVERALAPLLGDLPLELLTLGHVDTALIRAVQAGPDRLARLRPALAAFLDAAGHTAAARRCRDRQWTDVEAAVTADPSSLPAVLAGLEHSPYLPPHLLDFQFRPAPSAGEVRAQVAVARALEDAVEAGRLDLGAFDVADRRRQIAADTLDGPATAEDGSPAGTTWRQAVEADRLVAWRQSRSRERERLVEAVAAVVAAPVTAAELDPRLGDAAVAALEVAADGIGLRGRRLERGAALTLARRLGWPKPPRAARGDGADATDHLVAALARCGLLEPTGGQRVARSLLGTSWAQEPQALADHLCRWSFTVLDAVPETLLLLLLLEPEWKAADLAEAALTVVRAEGAATDPGDLRARLHLAVGWLVEAGRAHGFCRSTGPVLARRILRTGPGTAALRALVRGRATGSGVDFVPLG